MLGLLSRRCFFGGDIMHLKGLSYWAWLLKVTIVLHTCIQCAQSQVLSSSSSVPNVCTSKETCSECIAEDPRCAWCSKVDYGADGDIRKCGLIHNFKDTCKHPDLVVPHTYNHIVKNLELSDRGAKEHEAIQIKPQKIKLRIRPKSPQRITVQFRQAVDYPVDLYYLMDLSNSMKDDKDNLAKLGNELADVMKNITSNFKLGFGSFVDKVAVPYVLMNPNTRSQVPCSGCAAPYGFWNHMSLNENTEAFAKKVNESKISGNLDAPEGGLDAIMQVVVCQHEIKWRTKARKLLLFSSDNSFHYAGDGKMAGIIPPNDGECHLNSEGRYTMSQEQDYPSLSQLNTKVKENKVNLIFAVTSENEALYARLSKRLVGSYTGKLQNDSSNVVELVRQQYDKITSSVEMSYSIKDDPGNIKVTFHSKCFGDKTTETNVCSGLKVGANVTFDVDIEVTSCPKDPRDWNKTIEINPVGLHDHLDVHLEMVCECECEKPWNEERGSPQCNSGNGTYECGICSCYGNRYGRKCECDATESDPSSEDSGCLRGGDVQPCSGRGVCICGKCFCNKRHNPEEKIYGSFCQCDDFTCDRKDGKVCNGHGICDCGKCKCANGWSGKDCACEDNRASCVGDGGEVCSGRGQCICGECICDSSEQEYYGKHCDDCATCAGKCDKYRSCVECFLLENQGQSSGKNCSSHCNEQILSEDKMEVNMNRKEKICSFEDENNCRFSFKYIIDNLEERNLPFIYIQNEKECPAPVNMMAVVFGVTGSIVGIGLFLLLLLKLLTTIHDRRELAKFEKETQKAKWEKADNPLYVQATSTFQNPAYRGE